MDTAITFTSFVAAAFASFLAIDLAVAAIANRAVLRQRLDHPLRIVIGSTVCATLLLGVIRPAIGATPPPAIRLAADVGERVEPRGVGSPVVVVSSHTVERGDSLWRIARSTLLARGLPASGTDVAAFWPRIYEANREVIGDDPHMIHPGQVLTLPQADSSIGVPHGA